ncbi:MAG TPA: hypothetical protein VGH82_09875 [Gaiellaceae bacterium]|jgi:hypothetical protein
MRVLFVAAVSLVAAGAPAAGATPKTLVSLPGAQIVGFAQNGPFVAWFVKKQGHCNTVHIRSLANPLSAVVPNVGARNVTCTWQVGKEPIPLAIDANADTLWTLRESTPLQYDYLIGAGALPANQSERRLQQLAHTSKGAGLWLGGIVGSGNTLAYAVTSVDYQDEAGCLAGTDTCAMMIAGGGVYRFDGWHPKLVYNRPAVALAASDDTIAIVPTDLVTKAGKPVAGADLPIAVVDAKTSSQIASVSPEGTPIAIALSEHVLATMERTPIGTRIAWYNPLTGTAIGSAPVATAAAPELTVSDKYVVFRIGLSVRSIDITTGRIRTIARAASTPIGLSLVGTRLAWAEDLKNGGGRVRALYLASS